MKKGTLHVMCFLLFFAALPAISQTTTSPNIILIVSDDLNDYIEPLNGHPQVQTPAMNTLAERGMTFFNGYCNAPVCGPSRTSFMSGKDMQYTQVYRNGDYIKNFRENFSEATNNAEVYTLPEYLKNAGNYYTYGIDKVYHGGNMSDFDKSTNNPCEKELSWSKVVNEKDDNALKIYETESDLGFSSYNFGKLPNEVENLMKDTKGVDRAIEFIDQWADGEIPTCGGQFFLAVGIAKPHLDLFVPEKYFPPYYLDDIYTTPFVYPYNNPPGSSPANGLIMPPQPEVRWEDYFNLGSLSRQMATTHKNIEHTINEYAESVSPLPEINSELTEEERQEIIAESWRANAVMAYIAAVQYMDAQVGRLLDALDTHPAIKENSIIIFVGDNGFSFGQKHHWLKRSLWEQDIRVPMIIVDPSAPGNRVSYHSVSLLDLYPTICDYAGIPYPTFSDGSPYLDGHSMYPILQNENANVEWPALVTIKMEQGKEGSCFPQYAVRTERFSYIRNQSNNATIDSGDPCNWANSIREEQLYDVGKFRETDQYEWNNLIDSAGYEKVVAYLDNFLPDSSMYLQQPLKTVILNRGVPCLITHDATIEMKAQVFDTIGNLLKGAALNNYTLEWTNSITSDISYGNNYNFNMSTIPNAIYNNGSALFIYISVIENSTGKQMGFDTKTFYFNPINRPVASFNRLINDQTVSITDYTISGSYTSTMWDFGDSYTTNEFLPVQHTYNTPDVYTIKNIISYGNKPTCKRTISRKAKILGPLKLAVLENNSIEVFPNPANNFLNIYGEKLIGSTQVKIYNSSGQLMSNEVIVSMSGYINIKTQSLPSGLYTIHLQNETTIQSKLFIIEH
ncbi:MAG: sulfatase-like hydrolase/transferase [Chitinophagales bacterium]|nr:sulfatase-like hydrolase/transferase [Chitinophagales bacterium]MBP9190471.1 sulfatase-like hydrolase/transferase [Chitinophagales bacterium]MBP9548716.1 sulfatase-like hydrolase/transferase [Chitinophagales bacterium]MBP9705384.1 sulfatase-like hydrolase/transferase [Chitinophagales bacterium]